jgi:hypothetical protein
MGGFGRDSAWQRTPKELSVGDFEEAARGPNGKFRILSRRVVGRIATVSVAHGAIWREM